MNTVKHNAIWRDKARRNYLVALIEESKNTQNFMIQTAQDGKKKKMIAQLNEAILMIITSPGQEVFPLQ